MIQFKAQDAAGALINSALSPFSFPAGEAHTKREDRRDLESLEIAVVHFDPAVVRVDSSSMHDDLFQLAMWNDYITQENDIFSRDTKRVLIIPYFPGARADRGRPFGLSVYADFVRNLGLDQIIIFDPHSGMTGDELHGAANTLTIVHPHELFARHPQEIKHSPAYPYTGIIAPDKGARGRAQGVADALGLPCFQATKLRDFETGKLTGFGIDTLPETDPDGSPSTFLVVDDICDGGGTFLGLAKATALPPERLNLYVSHGVFSGNALRSLPKHYSRIFTTNSYAPHRQLTLWGASMDPEGAGSNIRVENGLPESVFRRIDVIRQLLERTTK